MSDDTPWLKKNDVIAVSAVTMFLLLFLGVPDSHFQEDLSVIGKFMGAFSVSQAQVPWSGVPGWGQFGAD